MSQLGDPIRGRVTASDLFRTVINAILEEKVKNLGGSNPPPTVFAYDQSLMYITHAEPTITTTTNLNDVYDGANAVYDLSTYT